MTVAHQMDPVIRRKLYRGNPYSFVSVNIDLQSHVGRLDTPTAVIWGRTKESPWREDRGACGAIIATLTGFNEHNAVHKRLRHNLGMLSFQREKERERALALSEDRCLCACVRGGRRGEL